MRLFSDQKKLLLQSYQAAGATIGSNVADEAIGAAYRQIAGCLPWSYLHRRTQINTVAAQSTGTIAYTSATRTLTLSGATFPSWAAQGLVIISGAVYAIQYVVDTTHAILVENRCPQANIAASTAYTLTKMEYLLPVDFLRVEEFTMLGTVWQFREMQPGSMLETARLFYNPARPWQYLVRGSTYVPGRMAIEFAPPPDAAYTIDLAYFGQPRQRTLAAPYSTGTITVSGTAVTGVGTAFTQPMVGCRLRQGTSESVPDGEYGVKGSTSENTIQSVTDATHLVLVDAGVTSSGVMYLIDDPVDIDRVSMDEVFCRMCEHQFEQLTHGEKRREKQQDVVVALNAARARDVRTSPRQQQYSIPTFEALAYASLRGQS